MWQGLDSITFLVPTFNWCIFFHTVTLSMGFVNNLQFDNVAYMFHMTWVFYTYLHFISRWFKLFCVTVFNLAYKSPPIYTLFFFTFRLLVFGLAWPWVQNPTTFINTQVVYHTYHITFSLYPGLDIGQPLHTGPYWNAKHTTMIKTLWIILDY